MKDTMQRTRTILAVALAAAAVGCTSGGEPQVTGRWQRVRQPTEWVEFRADGSFMGCSFMGTDTVRGTFRQAGDSVFTRSALTMGSGGDRRCRQTSYGERHVAPLLRISRVPAAYPPTLRRRMGNFKALSGESGLRNWAQQSEVRPR